MTVFENLQVLTPLLGGLLIGLAVAAMLFTTGHVLGISGVLGELFARRPSGVRWRFAVLAGLLSGGVVLQIFLPGAFETVPARSSALLITSGILVGFGSRLAGGCTSGHGLTGVARLSRRSIVATLLFVAAGITTAMLLRLAGGES